MNQASLPTSSDQQGSGIANGLHGSGIAKKGKQVRNAHSAQVKEANALPTGWRQPSGLMDMSANNLPVCYQHKTVCLSWRTQGVYGGGHPARQCVNVQQEVH